MTSSLGSLRPKLMICAESEMTTRSAYSRFSWSLGRRIWPALSRSDVALLGVRRGPTWNDATACRVRSSS
jgi:hypothetical protein